MLNAIRREVLMLLVVVLCARVVFYVVGAGAAAGEGARVYTQSVSCSTPRVKVLASLSPDGVELCCGLVRVRDARDI